jgi:hypothetical protein
MDWTGFFDLFDEEYTSRRDRDRDSIHLQYSMVVADMLHMRIIIPISFTCSFVAVL